MQAMACVRRGALASTIRAFSTIQRRRQQWNFASSEWLQHMDSMLLETFQNGKSFFRTHELILTHKFFSTDAWTTPQISDQTEPSSSEDENPELQTLNSEEEEDYLPEFNKTDKSPLKKKKRLLDDAREICQVLEKGDEGVEETLTQLGVHLTPRLVKMVLGNTSSPTSALRFFLWAKAQPGFKHNSSTYDKLGNTVGSFKDFETLYRVLSERFVEGCKISFKTFSFVTAWHDNPAIMDEVLEMIKKLELSPRRYAYERLVGALCRKNHVDVALAVLQKIASADCAPRMHAYRPLIQVYCKKNQIDKAQEVFEMMKDCPQDSICYNLVLSALCNKKLFAKATKFFQGMVNMGHKPDAIAYDMMICAACETGRIQGALQLFDKLKEEGIKPLYVTYTHLLNGLFQNNGFDKAHSFLIQQSGNDSVLDSINYTYLIRICRKSGLKEEADKLLMERKLKNLQPLPFCRQNVN